LEPRVAQTLSRRGFTLVELMVVVVIVGLMVGLAATRMDFMVPKYRLRGAAREVASLFKQARSRAAGSGKDVYVEMDLPRGQYWMLVAFPKAVEGFEAADPKALEYQPVFSQSLPEGVKFVDVLHGAQEKFDSGRARVRLTPFGSSSHVIVNLKNSDEREISLKFNGFTGSVSFVEGRQEAEEILEDTGT
jgi:type II secretion system protein H